MREWAVVLLMGFTVAPAARAADDALLEKGRAVWFTAAGVGCASCHGRFGEGDVGIGPFNRGVGPSKIKAAIATVPQMRILKGLSAAEIEAVTAYNSWLGEHQLVKTLLKRERFLPEAVDVYPGTAVQLAINNSGLAAHKFSGMGIADFEVAGRTVHDFIWRAPEQEGEHALRCIDCGAEGQQFTINVRRSAKRFRAPEAAK